MTVLPSHVTAQAEDLLARARKRHLKIATAESCTGGLIAACFTEIAGASDVFERGFVTYSNDSKQEMLGVPADIVERFGAVSKETARAMAEGALNQSRAQLSIAVTGIAGPSGGTREKPVGLVHIACGLVNGKGNHSIVHEMHRFGAAGRSLVRLKSIEAAFALLEEVLEN